MRRVIWAIARRSFAKGTHLKTQMSRASFWFSLLFIVFFVLYLMSAVSQFFRPPSSADTTAARILLVNSPASFDSFLAGTDKNLTGRPAVYTREMNGAYYDFLTFQEKIDNGDAQLIVVFPKDFDVQTADISGDARPQILTYYDPSDNSSNNLHEIFTKIALARYGDNIQKEYGRVSTSSPVFNVTSQRLSGFESDDSLLGSSRIINHMIIPLILFIAVMYACMESGMVSIAGEKERGTFAAILLTPARRIEIVLGNALGVLIHAMIPAVILILLFTAVFGYFTFGTILTLFLISLSLSMLMTALVLIISIMNRSILTAQASFLPIFFILMFVCITAMQEEGTPGLHLFLIPFYGHYYGLASALDGAYSPALLMSLLGICAAITAFLLGAAERLLHSERFTSYSDDSQEVKKELRRRHKDQIMVQKALKTPQNTIFGYHAKRSRPALGLLSYHFLLPLSVLSVVQTIALIVPILIYLRSEISASFISEFLRSFAAISAGADNTALAAPVNMALKLLSELMQTKSFVFSMAVSYVLVIAVYVMIIRFFEKQPLSSAGFKGADSSSENRDGFRTGFSARLTRAAHASRAPLTLYARGLLIGFVMMLSVFLLLLLSGQATVARVGMAPSSVGLFLVYMLMWIPQGACEELLFRGYMMPRLSAKFGRPAAVLLTSFSFGILHSGNAGFSLVAFINLILIAVFFALLALHTQEIWTVCAVHSVWNFSQGNLFGLQVSGTQSSASLMQTRYADESLALFTGGDFGPEGGLIVTAVIVLSLLILFFNRNKLKGVILD